ncbi:FtsK/SpoIIIE domain-containing protein [Streptomyces sp. HPF1205]|uniref:FtsK/SpoIIIE domain-containing protein n=1 Tax=Streptomyces sp. HPF1205 TaxID=2873262 RepID=UPI001CECB135|nr:FtsK/SpoIIIE domain-containing protein [Streptomyces sp. HPF1205]
MTEIINLDDHRPRPITDPFAKQDARPAPPLEGVMLPSDSTPDGEAVDRPDNPLADWLTVPDEPVLPPWLATPAALRANAGALVRLGGYHARYHGVRLPKYGVKTAGLACRGAWRCTARLWPVLTAADHTRTVKALAASLDARTADPDLAIRHQVAHRARTEARRWRFGSAVAVATGCGMALSMATTPVLIATATILLAILAVVGRKGSEVPFLDQATPPIRIDMNAQQLNDALRAAGLLKAGKGDEEGPKVSCVMGPVRDGKGWAVVFDLPRGGGKTAADVLAKRDALAAELGVDEIQVIMSRVRAAGGGHAGRVSMWVADDDPYLGDPNPSPLLKAQTFTVWDPIPFGQDARGNRVSVPVMWQSLFFGGLPRRGKTFTQRLMTAAGLLDPYVRHYVADGKGGADWMPMRHVAHRLVMGAEDDAVEALKAMLKELLAEMERRFALLRGLPVSICPEGKLTPAIVQKYNLPVIFVTIDELQEYFTAMEREDREQVVDDLCRIARRGPAAGFICNFASQRPDAESVPPKLREIITLRYCTQVVDRTSSDMVLGKGKAAQGADASVLSEEHKGTGVLVTGPASFVTVRADYLDGAGFTEMCQRGRALRQAAGQLTGDAAGDVAAAADQAGVTIAPVLSDCLDVMRHVDRMHTVDLLARLDNLDTDRYGDWDAERLARELEAAGVERTGKQVKIGNVNRAGYRRADLEAAVPPELLLAARSTGPVDPPPATSPTT